MLNTILLYLGAALLVIWGIAHIIPTRNVVAGFGALSEDNRINITMEWVAEGLALAFVGVLWRWSPGRGGQRSGERVVVGAVAGFCIVMGGWTFIVGRHSTIVPIRLCPLVLAVAAVLLVLGNVL